MYQDNECLVCIVLVMKCPTVFSIIVLCPFYIMECVLKGHENVKLYESV